MNGRLTRTDISHAALLRELDSVANRSTLHEEAFRRMFSLESKRAQRSRKSFLLALLEVAGSPASEKNRKTLASVLSVLDSNMRETDVTGWYKDNCVVGLMFTEIAVEDRNSILATITSRVNETLRSHLTPQQVGQVRISFHLFPEERDEMIISAAGASALYGELSVLEEVRRVGSR
ncbi:MAG: hypothetical protein WB919_19735 [Candidatus Sulfotelmatobacter sp.]